MPDQVKLTVSHAPFIHDGSRISTKHYNLMLAALIPVAAGIVRFGVPALAVVCLSVATAMGWELLSNLVMRRPFSIGDGNAAFIGLLLAMLFPATTPWWVVVVGTFVAVVIGKQIYGGIGGNPFHPVAVAAAVLMLSWHWAFDFNAALAGYLFDFDPRYPLTLLKSFGPGGVEQFSVSDLLMGRQVGGIGSTFGIGLIIAGAYLCLRGYIRWEITLSFIVGIIGCALCFHLKHPEAYAGPMIHLFSGYTLIGAVFLVNDDSSSPVHTIPMLIYGLLGGIMTVLIRNIGYWTDGVIFAILLINLLNPILDKIRSKAVTI